MTRMVSAICGLAVTVMMVAGFGAGVQAQVTAATEPDAGQIAAAKDLVKAMDAEGQARSSLEQLRQALIARVQASEPSKAVGYSAYADKAMQPDSALVKSFLSDIDNMAVQFYARNFTPDEMKAIGVFQSSEAGRKFNKLTPELGGLIAARMGQFQSDLIKAVEKGAAGATP